MTKTQTKVFNEILGEFQELSMTIKADEVSLKYHPNVGWFVSFVNDTNKTVCLPGMINSTQFIFWITSKS